MLFALRIAEHFIVVSVHYNLHKILFWSFIATLKKGFVKRTSGSLISLFWQKWESCEVSQDRRVNEVLKRENVIFIRLLKGKESYRIWFRVWEEKRIDSHTSFLLWKWSAGSMWNFCRQLKEWVCGYFC